MRMTVVRGAAAETRGRASSLCLRTGLCVPFSAVSLLCTSFPFGLRRIARSRGARVLVCVLALALTAANFLAVAMPPAMAAASAEGSADAPQHASHEHCAGHQAQGLHAGHARHGSDCACCIGKTCACTQIFDAVVLTVLPASILPSMRIFAVPPPRAYAAIEARLLRPPIA
jgi:hypothetical protein